MVVERQHLKPHYSRPICQASIIPWRCICGRLCYSNTESRVGGATINYYSNYMDVCRTWQGEREREKEREREMPLIKPSPVTWGGICERSAWALGQRNRSPSNDCLHNSPQWCINVEDRRLLTLLFQQKSESSWDEGSVLCEHAYANNADMCTRKWGSRLPAPLCMSQLVCKPHWEVSNWFSLQTEVQLLLRYVDKINFLLLTTSENNYSTVIFLG